MDRKDAIKSTIITFIAAFIGIGIVVGLGYLGIHVLWNNGHKVAGALVFSLPILAATVVLIYTEFRSL